MVFQEDVDLFQKGHSTEFYNLKIIMIKSLNIIMVWYS
jgi:hypothetical protein